jgi:hypothetical protein
VKVAKGDIPAHPNGRREEGQTFALLTPRGVREFDCAHLEAMLLCAQWKVLREETWNRVWSAALHDDFL